MTTENNNNTRKTLVISLLSGPGAGKSSAMATIFSMFKWAGIDCEMATEYAKDMVWSNATSILDNQIHVFGEQHNRIWRLNGKVDVIITDSPFILSAVYDSEQRPAFKALILKEFHKFNNLVVYVNRVKPYNPNGRIQKNIEAAREKDVEVLSLLSEHLIPYQRVDGTEESVRNWTANLIKQLKAEKLN